MRPFRFTGHGCIRSPCLVRIPIRGRHRLDLAEGESSNLYLALNVANPSPVGCDRSVQGLLLPAAALPRSSLSAIGEFIRIMQKRLGRLLPWALSIIIACAAIVLALCGAAGWWPAATLALAIAALGLRDWLQGSHAVQRNYPIIGHVRWLFESLRPALRQYLFEADEEAAPFSRAQRTLVYRRAKGEAGDHPFGTLIDVYRDGYEFINHSTRPAPVADPTGFRVTIGGNGCRQPYSASILNISAMSFGALSANAIRALNRGAARGGFYHDTGEGSISPYHREGGDLVWEIGSGYFGCRTDDGRFDPERFAEQAAAPQVRMIEIKLSQGAKPGHGGILPAAKVSAEIAATRGVPLGRDCISPACHTAFSTPLELMRFIATLRDLSGGKPVGFKLCIGHPWEFMGIIRAYPNTADSRRPPHLTN